MMYDLYSIYDTVSGVYNAPSIYKSKELAERDLRYVLAHDEKLRMNASDYRLVHVGSFNMQTGVISKVAHVTICSLNDLVVKENV